MAKRILGIVGSYRKNGTIDSLVRRYFSLRGRRVH